MFNQNKCQNENHILVTDKLGVTVSNKHDDSEPSISNDNCVPELTICRWFKDDKVNSTDQMKRPKLPNNHNMTRQFSHGLWIKGRTAPQLAAMFWVFKQRNYPLIYKVIILVILLHCYQHHSTGLETRKSYHFLHNVNAQD